MYMKFLSAHLVRMCTNMGYMCRYNPFFEHPVIGQNNDWDITCDNILSFFVHPVTIIGTHVQIGLKLLSFDIYQVGLFDVEHILPCTYYRSTE